MRIAITGPEGSGKTTLAQELQDRLHYPIVPEHIEEVIRAYDMWRVDLLSSLAELRTHPQTYFRIQRTLSLAKAEFEEKFGENFIADRTHLDGLAYTLLYLREHLSDEQTDEFVKQSVSRCKYDVIYYLPRMASPVGEGRRITATAHVMTYDLLLRGMYSYFDIPVVEVQALSIEGRVSFIIDDIARRLFAKVQ